MISLFPRQPFNITIVQAYAPTSNAEEAEVAEVERFYEDLQDLLEQLERFYEDLQDLLEQTPKKDILFTIRDWNAKVGSQGEGSGRGDRDGEYM